MSRFPAIFLHIVSLLTLASTALTADYGLIKDLPNRRMVAYREAQKGWDSGVTPTMRKASHDYIDALTAIIRDLIKGYYPKKVLGIDNADQYVKSLYAVHRFRQDMRNPAGEFQGTAATLDVPAEVIGELETTIEQMVEAIVANSHFDFKTWSRAWRANADQARSK